MGSRRGFTLIELLVVMVIVLMVSAVAIPAAVHAYGERSIQEAARLVQASLSAARDEARHSNAPRGIRLLPDPALPGFASRLVPLGPGPDYSEGLVTVTDPTTLPADFVLPFPCLMVEQARPDAPTSWRDNLRVGDRLRVADAGGWLTVCGPVDPANPTSEGFVRPVLVLDRKDGRGPLDYLWLTNGLDDDGDGFTDEGFDGIDNDVNGVTDEPGEWEVEAWHVPRRVAAPYAIRRRPVPAPPSRQLDLPASVVIDMDGTPAEFLIGPTGTVTASAPVTPKVAHAGVLGVHEIRLHLVERGSATGGYEAWVILNTRTGQVETRLQMP